MSTRQSKRVIAVWLALLPAWAAGCVITAPRMVAPVAAPTVDVSTPYSAPERDTRLIQPIRHQQSPTDSNSKPPADPFAGASTLKVQDLIRQVLARNPTIAQMNAAAQAAASRYPQVTSLEDPMARAGFGPATINAPGLDFAYVIEVSQQFPYPGKLRLRGDNAAAEARAADEDINDVGQRLAEVAKMAFYDFYLAQRAAEVNREGLELQRDFHKDAVSRYKAGLVPEQDVKLAEVEIGRQQERLLAIDRAREIAIARINTLMHRPPDAALPQPPRTIKPEGITADADSLRELARSQRPDLLAAMNRVEAERAMLALAEREYKPDFAAYAMWNKFMGNANNRMAPDVGFRMNLPIRYGRRAGAVSEAAARVAQRRAEYDRLSDQVQFEVQQTLAQVRESEKTARLYEETILPAARENVRAARAAYTTGKIPALSVIEAQRNLIMQRDRAYEVTADFYRRQAALERAIGGALPTTGREHLPQPKSIEK